jgi:hypothetical protein
VRANERRNGTASLTTYPNADLPSDAIRFTGYPRKMELCNDLSACMPNAQGRRLPRSSLRGQVPFRDKKSRDARLPDDHFAGIDGICPSLPLSYNASCGWVASQSRLGLTGPSAAKTATNASIPPAIRRRKHAAIHNRDIIKRPLLGCGDPGVRQGAATATATTVTNAAAICVRPFCPGI